MIFVFHHYKSTTFQAKAAKMLLATIFMEEVGVVMADGDDDDDDKDDYEHNSRPTYSD